MAARPSAGPCDRIQKSAQVRIPDAHNERGARVATAIHEGYLEVQDRLQFTPLNVRKCGRVAELDLDDE